MDQKNTKSIGTDWLIYSSSRLRSLTTLVLKLNAFHLSGLTIDLIDQLVASCREPKRKIIIEIHVNDCIDFPEILFKLENCQYIEIQQISH